MEYVWRGRCGIWTSHTRECVTQDFEDWDAINDHPAYVHQDYEIIWETGQDICHCSCHWECAWWLVLYAPMIRLYEYEPSLGEETYD